MSAYFEHLGLESVTITHKKDRPLYGETNVVLMHWLHWDPLAGVMRRLE